MQQIFAQDTLYTGVKGNEKLNYQEMTKLLDAHKEQLNQKLKEQKIQVFPTLKVKKIQQEDALVLIDVEVVFGNKKPDEFLDFVFIQNPINLEDKKLIGLEGEDFDIDRLKGRPTFINCWFNRCAPCIDEMPVLNNLKAKYENQMNFVAITFDDAKTVEAFLMNNKFDFTHFVDAGKLTEQLDIQGYPSNFFFDENLNVVSIEGGIPYIKGEEGKMKIGETTKFEQLIQDLLP